MPSIAILALCAAAVLGSARAIAAEASTHGATVTRAAVPHGQKAPRKKSSTGAEKPFGREGDPRRVKRVIRVDMSDAMRYFPSEIRVKRGDTVRFALRNSGQMPHKMVLGTMDELKKHAELMRAQAGEMDHDEAYVAHVEPGETGRIVWQFTRAGEFYYGCLVPGHFEAGMIGTIVVR